MSPGDVVLIPLPQVTGPPKPRPALVLTVLPGPYGDLLVCGVSTQLSQCVGNWDELIQPSDSDFATSGLHRASAIRLSFLHAADAGEVVGVIGKIDAQRLDRLLARLANHLHP